MKRVAFVLLIVAVLGVAYLTWQAIQAELRFRELYARLPKGWIVSTYKVTAFPAGKPQWKYPPQFTNRPGSFDMFASAISADEWRLYVDTEDGVEVYSWKPQSGATRFIRKIENAYLGSSGKYAADISGEVVAMRHKDTGGWLFLQVRTGKQFVRDFGGVYSADRRYCFWAIDGSWLYLYNADTNRIEQKIRLPIDLSKKFSWICGRVAVAPDGSYVAWKQDESPVGFTFKSAATIRVFFTRTKKTIDYKAKHIGTVFMLFSINHDFLALFFDAPKHVSAWIVVLDLKTGEYFVWKRGGDYSYLRFLPENASAGQP
jgi:hypothetical protein